MRRRKSHVRERKLSHLPAGRAWNASDVDSDSLTSCSSRRRRSSVPDISGRYYHADLRVIVEFSSSRFFGELNNDTDLSVATAPLHPLVSHEWFPIEFSNGVFGILFVRLSYDAVPTRECSNSTKAKAPMGRTSDKGENFLKRSSRSFRCTPGGSLPTYTRLPDMVWV